MEKTLLELAKEKKGKFTKGVRTEQEIELILAWLKEDISIKQLFHAMKWGNKNNFYAFVATGIRQAYAEEKIIIK